MTELGPEKPKREFMFISRQTGLREYADSDVLFLFGPVCRAMRPDQTGVRHVMKHHRIFPLHPSSAFCPPCRTASVCLSFTE
ncbi:unnamed protein product [Protopolystoma xenopodis]|uniref:Uncharacterized protein n=1 Tax=Protopolystoma xenopodis TaxID=117903 RepID=A0A448WIV7_9PLAT|nr:unnamed protein product [Protopolystoma xenopodis]